MVGIKLIETKIKAQGMKCRILSDMKARLAQHGLLGGCFSPVGIGIGAIAAAATTDHQSVTHNPDHEVPKG